jgi:hypothetical protein
MLRHGLKKLIKMITPFGLVAGYQAEKTKKKYLSWALEKEPLSGNRENKGRYIVTLTSYGRRVKSTAPYAICSLLNQTVTPDRIILWLAEGTSIPPLLKDLTKRGLEIEFCEDMKSYKKLIPALKRFPDDVLITADDDVYYPANWFEQLKNAYENDKTKIYAHRTHRITFDEQNNIRPYKNWRHAVNGGGGYYSPPAREACYIRRAHWMSGAARSKNLWTWPPGETIYGFGRWRN